MLNCNRKIFRKAAQLQCHLLKSTFPHRGIARGGQGGNGCHPHLKKFKSGEILMGGGGEASSYT